MIDTTVLFAMLLAAIGIIILIALPYLIILVRTPVVTPEELEQACRNMRANEEKTFRIRKPYSYNNVQYVNNVPIRLAAQGGHFVFHFSKPWVTVYCSQPVHTRTDSPA